MKAHKGMRPQDVIVLLKIIAKGKKPWQNKDLALELAMSSSEITESLNRSAIAGLIDPEKKNVFMNALNDFLIYGLKYVFPVQPGALVRGIPTAHSAPVMKNLIVSEEPYVWPDHEGSKRGQAIEPLYNTVSKAVKKDERLYDLLALVDTLRVGKAREIKIAKELFQKTAKKYAYESSR